MTDTRTAPVTDDVVRPRSRRRISLVVLAIAALALLLGMFLGGSAYTPATSGVADPGPVVGWGLPIAKLALILAATLTIGFLTSAAFLIPGADKRTVSHAGRRDVRAAGWSALCWAIASLAAIVFGNAAVVGAPLLESLDPDLFWTFAFEPDIHRAYLLVATLAVVVAVSCLFTVRTGAAAVLLLLCIPALIAPTIASHSSSVGDHSLATTAGAVHAIAAALWVGSLIAVARHIWIMSDGVSRAVSRFAPLALACVIALALSGAANSYTRLESPADLLATGYGLLILIKVGLLVVLVLLARRARLLALTNEPAQRRALLRWLVVEICLLAATIGIAASLTQTAFPRADVPLPSAAEQLLGFPFPPPPDWTSIVFGWYPDAFFLLLCGVLLVGYLLGVVRLHRSGVSWPWGRTLSWLLGVAVLAWATNAGIAGYAKVSVQWHMVQHMTIGMLVPVLLVMGVPATLALRALPSGKEKDRGAREWALWGLHSPISSLLTHPLVVLALGTFGLYGLYFTPLFELGMSSHIGHVFMTLHFMLSGFLFFWVVLGLDPGPRRVPPWARLILLLVYISLHGLFAVALMSLTEPLAESWFTQVQPPWLGDPLTDTLNGGGVAWAFGEIPAVIAVIVVSVQWARSEERAAAREDRQSDRDDGAELRAYNERLARLAARSDSDSVK